MNAKAETVLFRLVDNGCEIAMRAAADRFRIVGISPKTDDEFQKATELIREAVKECVNAALSDLREALEAGMGRWGEEGFKAEMRLAGIRAADRYVGCAVR